MRIAVHGVFTASVTFFVRLRCLASNRVPDRAGERAATFFQRAAAASKSPTWL